MCTEGGHDANATDGATLRHHWQNEMRRHVGRVVDSLGCGNVIRSRCLVDVWHELLGIAIDHWKPCGLNLHHDAVTFDKDVVVIAQWDGPFCWLVRSERLRRFVAGEIASAANFH